MVKASIITSSPYWDRSAFRGVNRATDLSCARTTPTRWPTNVVMACTRAIAPVETSR